MSSPRSDGAGVVRLATHDLELADTRGSWRVRGVEELPTRARCVDSINRQLLGNLASENYIPVVHIRTAVSGSGRSGVATWRSARR